MYIAVLGHIPHLSIRAHEITQKILKYLFKIYIHQNTKTYKYLVGKLWTFRKWSFEIFKVPAIAHKNSH